MGTERQLRLQITGLVQGVGFRPRVHALASQLHLKGWVRNGPGGVELMLEGAPEQLQSFLERLQNQPPPRSRIDRITARWAAASRRLRDFRILEPLPMAAGGMGVASAAISPDQAICRRCLAELADPGNRRHRYPFISCTDCGPRYSLLRQLPFERAHTSLRDWPLCAACRREYADPSDRRFHAQTLSCPACGPRLEWHEQPRSQATATGAISDNNGAVAAAAAALRQGGIVAVQGIGGFQLLVDPANSAAVAELRRRKGRPHKPLALLACAAWLEHRCSLSPLERELWWSAAAPILLLLPRCAAPQAGLVPGVAAGSPWLGAMRAASGLQQLLLEACGGVLVATSANRSGEPIAADAHQDGAVLAQLADGVLSHGLRIINRIDDTVLRLAAGRPLVLRLGRGLAPLTLPDPPSARSAPAAAALALGAQIKGSLALRLPQALVLSPDLGDLSSSAGGRHLLATTEAWLARHRLVPALIHCDRHPGYSASQLAAALAAERRRPLRRVQHHHAHLLAVMAEHGLSGEQIGVAWDGSGQGDDGQLWGGEALAVSAAGYRRLARLRPFPLPGGEQAQREPRRAALGLLISAWGNHWREQAEAFAPLAWMEAFPPNELTLLSQACQHGINSPWCSSGGRLFDGLAALLGVQQCCSFEGQAAIALEALAMQAAAEPRAQAPPHYNLLLCPGDGPVPWEWDWRPLMRDLLRDAASGSYSRAAIALGVHRALAHGIAELAAVLGLQTLLLSGGCFQNRILLESTIGALQERGLTVHWPQRLPCNDAALAAGQLLVRAA